MDQHITEHIRATVAQRESVCRLSGLGWTFLCWAEIPTIIAVMKSPKGKTACIYPEGAVSVRNRHKDFRGLCNWSAWKERFRGLFLKKDWRKRGEYAKGTTPRGSIIAIIIEKISEECTYWNKFNG